MKPIYINKHKNEFGNIAQTSHRSLEGFLISETKKARTLKRKISNFETKEPRNQATYFQLNGTLCGHKERPNRCNGDW